MGTGPHQLMEYTFLYYEEVVDAELGVGRRKTFVDIEAPNVRQAGLEFVKIIHEILKEGRSVEAMSSMWVSAAHGPYRKMYRDSYELKRAYKVQRASDAEGKRRKKQVVVSRLRDNTKHYFSSFEKACRWVVMDA